MVWRSVLAATSAEIEAVPIHRFGQTISPGFRRSLPTAVAYRPPDRPRADVLDRVGTHPFEIDLLLADRGFYNERVIRRARDLATTVIPVQKKGERIQDKLATHCSYMTTYRMYKDSERELRFPLAVSVSYQNGDRDKHGEVVCGYVACDLGDRTPTQVERRYRKRSAIETSYRLFRQARATTTTQDPLVRFAFVIVSFLLENLWLVLRWAVVARPRRGGRDLPEQFTFSTFCDWIRHELEAELERRWEIEMNDIGVPDTYASGQRVVSSSTRQKPLRQPFSLLSLFSSDRRFDPLSYRSEIERLRPTQLDFQILDWEVPIVMSCFTMISVINLALVWGLWNSPSPPRGGQTGPFQRQKRKPASPKKRTLSLSG